jgi:hypothetical protein
MDHLRCCGPTRRREILKLGLLGLGSLSFGDFALAAPVPQKPGAPDRSLILFWMWGGPSQLETWDPKPNAPAEIRGPFGSIETRIPGARFSEIFPKLAGMADRLAVVRSLHHTMTAHNDGTIEVLTGKTPEAPDPTSAAISKHPDLGMIVSRMRGLREDGIPQYVGVPTTSFATRPNYLGAAHKGFNSGDPTRDDPTPPELNLAPGLTPTALDRRAALLRRLETDRTGADGRDAQEGFARLRDAGVHLLTRPEVGAAFDLRKEDPALRDRYGRHLWGQSCLLARRLTEAGAGVVIVDASAPMRDAKIYWSWDDHANASNTGWDIQKGMALRAGYMDQALTALVQDVYDRGLDKKVMVAALGEFGRSPSMEKAAGCTGRSHWPGAFSALLSGGGMRTGQVIGATDAWAGEPTERPLTPQDLHATFYRHLGIDPDTAFEDFTGRPIPILSSGEPIRELL